MANIVGIHAARSTLRYLSPPVQIDHWTDKAVMVKSGIWLPKTVVVYRVEEDGKSRTLLAIADFHVKRNKQSLSKISFS